MNFSPSYISAVVIIITSFGRLSTIDWSSPEAVTPLITAGITLIGGLIIAYRKYREGTINLIGGRIG